MGRLVRTITSTLTEVAEAAADAEAYCASLGADESQSLRIGLALDELAANALVHGAKAETAPDIKVEVWGEDDMLRLRVTAKGARFDPRDGRPDIGSQPYSLGGRGLTMVIAFADEISYSRRDPYNITTFSVFRNAEHDGEPPSKVEDGGNGA
ncbi:MAG: ATP-binding protein [Pseudomonadota bacterium]